MTTGMNDLKTLIKHVLCQCKLKFGSSKLTRIKFGILINVVASAKTQKDIMYMKRIIFGYM